MIEAEAGSEPTDASIAIDWVTPIVTPAAEGTAIDRDATREALLDQAVRFEVVALDLPIVVASPEIGTDEAAALAAQLETALAAPLALTNGLDAWRIAPEVLVNCVAPGLLEGTRATANLRPEAVEAGRKGALLGKAADKDDCADQVVTMCRTNTMTGQTLVIDSGRTFH